MQHRHCRRMIAPTLGAALLAATLAPGVAGATETRAPSDARLAAAICDYQQESTDTAQSSPIDERYESDAQLREALGEPAGPEQAEGDVRWRAYENGRLYWTEEAGVHAVFGDILAKFLDGGGHQTYGVPMTDECEAQEGARYNHFTGTDATGRVSIYWRGGDAFALTGQIRQHWEASGWERGTYGFPTGDTTDIEGGKVNEFEGDDTFGANIYWSANSGAHGVKGKILETYLELGGPGGDLGFPTTDEKPWRGDGKRSNFQGGWITRNGSETDHGTW
ncbi:LGFP repeat-containing protein [Prauserella rugosa]|uniref:LGFP repeat-containing protein n=2 Tax=Prauserella rugosa TaxID=43354 RepID=A0A660CBW9_9PSEU|nr:LGFP repeat-containing protein [Prauserella rugosa]